MNNETDKYLANLPEWQKQNLVIFRTLIHKASPDITEQIKWSVPVFMHKSKMLFAMSSFKAHTKYNFIGNGATLSDPAHLFNNGLESKKSRSIDLHEGETTDQAALLELIKQAINKA